MTIIKRTEIGRPLTWAELDSNFEQVDSLVSSAASAVQTATNQADSAAASANSSFNSSTSAAASAQQAELAAAEVAGEVETQIVRTVRAPTGETLGELPAAASRADSFISTDATGNITVTPKTTVAASGNNSDITSLSGLTTPISAAQGGTGSVSLLDSYSVAGTSNISATVNYVILNGYYTSGDGGRARYKRVAAQPSHPGKFQSADGAWWEIDEPEINLLQTGCLGDSTSGTTGSGTDNTSAFIKARDIAYALGVSIIVPALAKTKAFRLASTISCENTISIRGYGANVTVGQTVNIPDGGSWLFFDHAGIGITFRDNTTPSNSDKFARITGIGIDRVQSAPASGWTPSTALEDIHVEFNVDLDDVFFLKSSRCVKIRSAGQLQTRRVRGQALVLGFECERSSDVQRWDGDHFWPYWTQDTNVITYTKQNAYCYSIRRADGLMIDSAFGIFYKRVFYASDVSGDLSGLANFHLRNLYADIGGGGIEINSNFYSAYGTIESYICNSDVGGNGTDGAAFTLAGSVASNIKLGMRSNRSPAESVLVSGAAHQVYLTATYLNGWAFVTSGSYAIKITGGGAIRMGSNPQITTGNSLFYSKDATSSIIFPLGYDLTGAAVSPLGFYSRRITVADDAAAVVAASTNDFTSNMHITPTSVPAAGNPAGSVWLRASSSPSAAIISLSTTTNVSVTTGILTGTTGTDGNLTISAANNGNYYIENRTGASKTFIITLMGN